MSDVSTLLFRPDKHHHLSIVLSDDAAFIQSVMDMVHSDRTIVLTSRGSEVQVREGVIYYTYSRNLENSIYFMNFMERLIFRIFLGGYIADVTGTFTYSFATGVGTGVLATLFLLPIRKFGGALARNGA